MKNNRKKLILFIVEGITDKTSLSRVLHKYLQGNSEVRFEITHGDITSNRSNTPANILGVIGNIVNKFRKIYGLKKTDFYEVVQLVDTDGAFVDSSNIKSNANTQKLLYLEDCIQTKNIENIKQRNLKKSSILNRLVDTQAVCSTIPYSVYFFSCNLEHVFHNEANMPDKLKSEQAYAVSDKYSNPRQFISFIEKYKCDCADSYLDTWEFIKLDTNSLKRYTNFNLYFSNSK